jgi:hypothetical protein
VRELASISATTPAEMDEFEDAGVQTERPTFGRARRGATRPFDIRAADRICQKVQGKICTAEAPFGALFELVVLLKSSEFRQGFSRHLS